MKVLNGTKLILDDQDNHLDSFRINLESFKSFRGPLFYKPVTGQVLFFLLGIKKQALVIIISFQKILTQALWLLSSNVP